MIGFLSFVAAQTINYLYLSEGVTKLGAVVGINFYSFLTLFTLFYLAGEHPAIQTLGAGCCLSRNVNYLLSTLYRYT